MWPGPDSVRNRFSPLDAAPSPFTVVESNTQQSWFQSQQLVVEVFSERFAERTQADVLLLLFVVVKQFQQQLNRCFPVWTTSNSPGFPESVVLLPLSFSRAECKRFRQSVSVITDGYLSIIESDFAGNMKLCSL